MEALDWHLSALQRLAMTYAVSKPSKREPEAREELENPGRTVISSTDHERDHPC